PRVPQRYRPTPSTDRCRASWPSFTPLLVPRVCRRGSCSAEAGAGVEAAGIVPQQLRLARLRQLPAEHDPGRFREMALAVRVVGGVHQDFVAEEVADGVGQGGALGDFDALKIAPAGDVFARPLL